jgi:molybdopterin-containing oxidoreductase family membrane subunit
MLIPVVLLLNRRTRTPLGVMYAGLLSTFGIFFMRFDLVIAGQLVSMREGAGDLVSGLLQYTPSLVEVAIVVGAISTCLFLYTMAEKFLPLENEHQ